MNKKKLQLKYDKLLKDFDEGHRKLKSIKQEMVEVRKQIVSAPIEYEERVDEIALKRQ